MSLKKGLQKPGRTPAFTFDLYVPRMTGRTDLLSLFLEIVGGTAAL
jgi:hypothetical protein